MYDEMHKLVNVFTAVMLVLLLVISVVFLCGRWGWKLQGFRYCEVANIQAVTVEDGQVRLTGAHMGVPPEGFLGYLYDEARGELHVGLRFDGFYGIFEDSDFDITVPVENQVNEVYLVTDTGSQLIWTREKGLLTD